MRLSHGLFLIVVLALALPVALEVVDVLKARDQSGRALRDAALLSAETISTRLERAVDGARRMLDAFAQMPMVQALDLDKCNRFFTQIDPGDPTYRDLAVVDRNGNIVCASRPALLGTPVRDRPSVAAAFAKRFVVGNYAIDGTAGQPVLPLAAPVMLQGDVVVAVLVLTIDLDALAAQLGTSRLPRSGTLVVTDRTGIILARVPGGIRGRGQTVEAPIRALLAADRPGVVDLMLDGRPGLVAYAPPSQPPYGLFVAVAVDKASFFAPLDRDAFQSAMVIAVAVAIALLAASGLATHFVTGPIAHLTEAATRWQHGDYAARAHAGSHIGEIDALVTAFDALVAKLAVRERELRAAAEGKRRLLAAAGHDLRQPLQILVFVIGRLGHFVTGEAERHHLARAEKALDRLTEALDTLVEAARLDSGTTPVRRRAVILADLLDELKDDWIVAAEAKGLRLRVAPTRAVIESDPNLVRTILNNLVGNAIKYTTRGGILVAGRRRGDHLSIEVWDTGIGIPADQVEHVFDEFAQLDRAREGFGLGLAIVQRAAELLRHPLSVSSRLGRGSRFAVTVPLASSPPR